MFADFGASIAAEIGGDNAACCSTFFVSFFSNGECLKFGMLFHEDELKEDFGFLNFNFKGKDDSKILAISRTGMAELFGLQLRSLNSDDDIALGEACLSSGEYSPGSSESSTLVSLGETEMSLEYIFGI